MLLKLRKLAQPSSDDQKHARWPLLSVVLDTARTHRPLPFGQTPSFARPAVGAGAPAQMPRSAYRHRGSAAPLDKAPHHGHIASWHWSDVRLGRFGDGWSIAVAEAPGARVASQHVFDRSTTRIEPVPEPLHSGRLIEMKLLFEIFSPRGTIKGCASIASICASPRTCARARKSTGKIGDCGYFSSRYSRIASDCTSGGPSPSSKVGQLSPDSASYSLGRIGLP